MDIETQLWSAAITTGTPPEGRNGHSASVVTTEAGEQHIYFFGGLRKKGDSKKVRVRVTAEEEG